MHRPLVQSNDRLFVITGGPGVGKTAILCELERRGFPCVPEAARQIIQEQVRTGGDAVPWLDAKRYASLMLKRSVEDYLKHSTAKRTTFFDRGILDTFTHARVSGFSLSEAAYIEAQKYHYNRLVLMTPPWREIYETDAERKQTFEESLVVYRVNAEIYREYGYDIVEIPCAPVQERVDFILDAIGEPRT